MSATGLPHPAKKLLASRGLLLPRILRRGKTHLAFHADGHNPPRKFFLLLRVEPLNQRFPRTRKEGVRDINHAGTPTNLSGGILILVLSLNKNKFDQLCKTVTISFLR